jgi:hypothetical protein
VVTVGIFVLYNNFFLVLGGTPRGLTIPRPFSTTAYSTDESMSITTTSPTFIDPTSTIQGKQTFFFFSFT